MTEQSDDGGPAFPTSDTTFLQSMSLRDYFAGQALTKVHDGGAGRLLIAEEGRE